MSERWLLIVYLVSVGLLGMGAVARVYLGLVRNRLSRLRRLANKARFEAVPTGTPIDDPQTVARNRAYESIQNQFSVTRFTFVPMVILITLAAMSLPFLERAPATLVSLLVTVITLLGGIAARPFLENAVSGLAISSSRLINLGDTVKVGAFYGTVEDITATHTTIKLWDWRRYVVPNSQMLQSTVLNYSLFDRHIWASVEFWVAYQVDLDQVRAMAVEVAQQSKHFAQTEPPEFWVMELGKDGIRCMVAAWAKLPSDAWMLKHDIRSGLAALFRQGGLRASIQHHQVVQDGAGEEGMPTFSANAMVEVAQQELAIERQSA